MYRTAAGMYREGKNKRTEQQQECKEKGRTRGQTAAGNIKRRGELEDRQQQGK